MIYNSYGLLLSAHEPFKSAEAAVREETDICFPSGGGPQKFSARRLVGDTDNGAALKERIRELKMLLQAYRDGLIIEKK